MRKVVLDTNVLVSGVIASGCCAAIVDAVRQGEIVVVSSPHLLEEFEDVIARRHIARKYPKAAKAAEFLLDFLRVFAILTPGIPGSETASRDRDDDFVLACALEGDVECVVSGDPHLLELREWCGIPILTPRQFVLLLTPPARRK